MLAVMLAAAVGAAFVDWWAVHRDNDAVEEIAKPAVLLLLIAAAVTLDPSSETLRWWFVAGLGLSLIGDVALLPRFDAFVVGLGSFLIAHVAYTIGMTSHTDSWILAALALLLMIVGAATVGLQILRAVNPELRIPVTTYLIAISAMLISAYATGSWVLAIGSLSFVVSDSLLGHGRFVGPAPGGRFGVHVTYHFAQTLLVVALI